jgi:hypothetical protein
VVGASETAGATRDSILLRKAVTKGASWISVPENREQSGTLAICAHHRKLNGGMPCLLQAAR